MGVEGFRVSSVGSSRLATARYSRRRWDDDADNVVASHAKQAHLSLSPSSTSARRV